MEYIIVELDNSGLKFPFACEKLDGNYARFPQEWDLSDVYIATYPMRTVQHINLHDITTLWPRINTRLNGWLSPEGKMFNAPVSGHHFASVMLQRFVDPFDMGRHRWVSDRLEQLGWMHVDAYDGAENKRIKEPTQAQKDWMYEYDRRSFKKWLERELGDY